MKGEILRIAYFVSEYTLRIVGGLGACAQDMCQALKELGHDVTIFTLNVATLETQENISGLDTYRPMTIDLPKGVLDSLLPNDMHYLGIPEKYSSQLELITLLQVP